MGLWSPLQCIGATFIHKQLATRLRKYGDFDAPTRSWNWVLDWSKFIELVCLSQFSDMGAPELELGIGLASKLGLICPWYLECQSSYGRKSADCTKHENDVIFFVFLATVFGNLEFLKVQK